MLFLGASSAGKTSAARATAELMPRPTVLLPGDDVRIPTPSAGRDWITRSSPEVVERFRLTMDSAYYDALAAFARRGFYAVGEVGIRDEARREGLEVFRAAVPSVLVRLHCPLEVLIERELARGDRPIGIAEESALHELTDLNFDLQIDTAAHTPNEVAAIVIHAADERFR